MKKIVTRERNKAYYRVLHAPIWVWVFWILPGHLTFDLYLRGPDHRHWTWLAVVIAVCAWRGFAGRLPGVEPRPYITHYGVDAPNLGYRVVCYTAAWIDLLVPWTLNFLGLVLAVATGEWRIAELYRWMYYPLALAIALATALNLTPRARRSVKWEGVERAWFYVTIWTVVPSQAAAWAMWRLGPRFGFEGDALSTARLVTFVAVSLLFFVPGFYGRLPRTPRDYELGDETTGV